MTEGKIVELYDSYAEVVRPLWKAYDNARRAGATNKELNILWHIYREADEEIIIKLRKLQQAVLPSLQNIDLDAVEETIKVLKKAQ